MRHAGLASRNSNRSNAARMSSACVRSQLGQLLIAGLQPGYRALRPHVPGWQVIDLRVDRSEQQEIWFVQAVRRAVPEGHHPANRHDEWQLAGAQAPHFLDDAARALTRGVSLSGSNSTIMDRAYGKAVAEGRSAAGRVVLGCRHCPSSISMRPSRWCGCSNHRQDSTRYEAVGARVSRCCRAEGRRLLRVVWDTNRIRPGLRPDHEGGLRPAQHSRRWVELGRHRQQHRRAEVAGQLRTEISECDSNCEP